MRKEYATVKEMPALFPFLSCPGLRHMIYENRNGIHKCVIRMGGKILFDLVKFESWLDSQNMANTSDNARDDK